jgi:hypothetical protein
MPDPIIKKPNQHFDATTYTATGTTPQTVTNAGSFKPDLVWTKNRTSAGNHYLNDSVRGAANALNSNTTSAEASLPNYITSFNSNGYGIGSDNFTSGQNIVGWQWKAGEGTTTVNTSGTISSNVSVNTTAGFSVVTYTGATSGAKTVGHGLGVAPKMIIIKWRTGGTGQSWAVYHASLGNDKYLALNSTAAATTDTNLWQNTAPTSSVFSVGYDTWVNSNGFTYVAYCWAEVEGYSKFGSYTGNGSADGPFQYTGFRPKFVVIKKTSNATNSNWLMQDTSRETYNANNYATLAANLNSNEPQSGAGSFEGNFIDYLSNGFKIRSSGSNSNESSSNYIYMAFAESPFKYSNAR